MNSKLQYQQLNFERALFFLFVLTLPLLNPWVRGDGVGYYAYARAPLIEHSLDFTHDYQSANESFRKARCDATGQPKAEFRTRTGHLDNHFTVGPAILWSPFLLLAHSGVLFARTLGIHVAANGFSAPYRYAIAFATGLYGFLALFLSFRLASKYVGPTWSFVATLTIWWASSLPVYMYFNPSWSHAHSAFMVALFLWYWEQTRDARNARQWVVLGFITGLMLNVYYANLMVVTVVLVEAVWQHAEILRKAREEHNRSFSLLSRQFLFGVVVCMCLLPTFVSRSIVYGGPFETGYLSIRNFLWSSPVFLQLLFSANHGLLSWTPVLILSLIGSILFIPVNHRIGVPFLAAIVTFYLFFSLYPDWAGISSFGNRFFISLTALFIFGLGVTLKTIAVRFSQQRMALLVFVMVLSCFVLWNLGMIYQWGTHLIPARGPISFTEVAYNQFHVVPRQIGSQLTSYFLRRSDVMQQLERKDIEQMRRTQQTNPDH